MRACLLLCQCVCVSLPPFHRSCVVVFYGTFYHDYRVIDNVLNENPATVGVSAGGEDDGIEMQMRARSLVDHPGRSAAEDVEEGTGDEHESRGLLATE